MNSVGRYTGSCRKLMRFEDLHRIHRRLITGFIDHPAANLNDRKPPGQSITTRPRARNSRVVVSQDRCRRKFADATQTIVRA
jgi:hypothetical protein